MPAAPSHPLTAEQSALVTRWMRLVYKYANRQFARVRNSHPGITREDVLEACYGVAIAAARGYDPNRIDPNTGRPAAFSSYLVASLDLRLRSFVNRHYQRERDHGALRFSELAKKSRSGLEEDFTPADPRPGMVNSVSGEEVRRMLAKLPTVEAAVVWRRFGLDGGKPMTVEEVGDELNMRPADVQEHEAAAMERMRASA